MDPQITELIKTVVVPFAILLIRWVVQDLIAWYESQPQQEQKRMHEAALTAVRAAEQAMSTQAGRDKRDYAIETTDKFLTRQGIYVSTKELLALVEAAVYAEFNKNRAPELVVRG
jgi:hypothetical protein